MDSQAADSAAARAEGVYALTDPIPLRGWRVSVCLAAISLVALTLVILTVSSAARVQYLGWMVRHSARPLPAHAPPSGPITRYVWLKRLAIEHGIEPGMTQAEVQALIGLPTDILRDSSGTYTLDYDGRDFLAGGWLSVKLDANGKVERVVLRNHIEG